MTINELQLYKDTIIRLRESNSLPKQTLDPQTERMWYDSERYQVKENGKFADDYDNPFWTYRHFVTEHSQLLNNNYQQDTIYYSSGSDAIFWPLM